MLVSFVYVVACRLFGLVLLLAGLLTAWEVPLLRTVHGGPGPDTLHVVVINGFTSAWVITSSERPL